MALASDPESPESACCRVTSETEPTALAEQLDQLEDQPTAWFCANDVLAFHLIRCLRDRGVDVPRHVSVIGFDDLPLALVSEPPLTTLRVDPNLFAQRAVDRLVWRMAHPDGPIEHLSIRPTFVSRDSVATHEPSLSSR